MFLKAAASQSLQYLIAFCLALGFLITLNPYFIWDDHGVWGQFSAFLILVSVIGIVVFGLFNEKIAPLNFSFFVFYVFVLLSMEIPVRSYDRWSTAGSILLSLSPLALLLSRRDLAVKSYKCLYYFFLLICFFSLANLFLYSIGAAVASKRVYLEQATFYVGGFDYYTLAPVLFGQYMNEVSLSFYRNNGWFYEPGHFAVYLGLILALQEKPFEGVGNRIIILTLLTTFSGVGYLFIVIFLLRQTKQHYRVYVPLIILGFFILLSFAAAPEGAFIVEKYFTSKMRGGDTLSARQTFSGPMLTDLAIDKFLWGFGGKYLDINNWMISDFTSHIYRYGFMSFVIYVAFVLSVFIYAIKKEKKILLMFTLFFLIVYTHRFFIAVRPVMIYLFWIALSLEATMRDSGNKLVKKSLP